MSINHNWINAHNLELVFEYLEGVFWEIQDLIKEHSDMDDFQGHCQKILKANCGMNIYGFLDMIDNSMDMRITRSIQKASNQDYESLGCFLKVLDRCSKSKIVCESLLPRILALKKKGFKFLKRISISPNSISRNH